MLVKNEELERIASIAKLQLRREEKEKFRKNLGDIVGFIRVLQSINVEGVEPLLTPLSAPGFLKLEEREESSPTPSVLTPDQQRGEDVSSVPSDSLFLNAPCRRADFFAVPKVL